MDKPCLAKGMRRTTRGGSGIHETLETLKQEFYGRMSNRCTCSEKVKYAEAGDTEVASQLAKRYEAKAVLIGDTAYWITLQPFHTQSDENIYNFGSESASEI